MNTIYIELCYVLHAKIIEKAKKENISAGEFILNTIRNKLQISDETIKQEISKHKEKITKSLQKLKNFYEICNKDDVFNYLVDYPDCIPRLIEAEKHIEDVFPAGTKSSIEIEHDPECADCDNLWVNITNNNYNYETMLNFQNLFDDWLLSTPWFCKAHIMFNLG